MVNKIGLLLVIFISCFIGCVNDNLSFDHFEKNSDKSRYIKKKKVDWLTMETFMKPNSYFLNMEKNQNANPDLEALTKDLEAMVYFDLRLSVNNTPGSHIENYNVHNKFEQDQRIHYLSFSMRDDLYLEQDGKKIPCELFHFERDYSLGSKRTFTLGFPKKELVNDKPVTIVFDSGYLQTGPLKIRYSEIDFSDASQIEL